MRVKLRELIDRGVLDLDHCVDLVGPETEVVIRKECCSFKSLGSSVVFTHSLPLCFVFYLGAEDD